MQYTLIIGGVLVQEKRYVWVERKSELNISTVLDIGIVSSKHKLVVLVSQSEGKKQVWASCVIKLSTNTSLDIRRGYV